MKNRREQAAHFQFLNKVAQLYYSVEISYCYYFYHYENSMGLFGCAVNRSNVSGSSVVFLLVAVLNCTCY